MIKPQRNPYIIGRPIDEREFFVGRESLFRFIAENLRRREKVILLHGQRRIGKSSIIRNIPQAIKAIVPDEFVFVAFDLQDYSHQPISTILAALAQEIVDHLEQLGIENIKPPEISELEADSDIFSSKFLPQVYEELCDKNLVLLLDEFDALDTELSESSIEHFFTFLYSLIQENNKLFIVSFLGRQSADMSQLLSIFKNAPITEIKLLDEESTYRLITQPAKGVLNYESDALAAIFKLSAGHPYFTQMICFAIFMRARERDIWKATAEDVEAIVDRAIELAEAGLAWFWDGLTDAEKLVFSAVAEAQKIAIEQNKVTPQDALILLKGLQVNPDGELIKAVKQLIETDILDKQGHKVKIELVRRWILQHHPLKQQIDEFAQFGQKKTKFFKEIKNIFSQHEFIENNRIEKDEPHIYNDTLVHNYDELPSYKFNYWAVSWHKLRTYSLKSSLMNRVEAKQYKAKSYFLSVILVGTAISTTIVVGFGIYQFSIACSHGEKKVFGILCVDDPSINISRGDRTFFLTTFNRYRDLAIEEFKNRNYTEASALFQQAVVSDRTDPEVLIYYNNVRASQKGSPLTLAVSIPGDNPKWMSQEILRGVAQAQNQFNTHDGLDGKLLQVVVANDGNEPEQAKQVSQVLIKDTSILGVIGHSSSNVTQATLSEYEKAHLAIISPTSTNNSISEKILFRTTPADTAMGKSLAEYAENSLGIKKVVIFYSEDSSYSNSLKEAFKNSFQQQGGRVQKQVDWSELEVNSNLQRQLSTLKSETQAEAFVFFTSTDNISDALAVAQNANKLGIKLLGNNAFYSNSTLSKASLSLEGLIIAIPWFRETPKSQKFVQAALKQWGGYVSWRTASSYDATQAFIKAFTNISPNFSRENLLQGLRQINLSSSDTSGEPLKFTDNGERQSQPVLIQVKEGKFTLVTSGVTPFKLR
ncbi:ABC transporter substrate-binding protein [Calothrix sp. FACHB-156]|nr:ABC transporter substrate-binding protein [Calothrix sp. FACHB-156]